jgi:uncharacterized membrane-anchored protein
VNARRISLAAFAALVAVMALPSGLIAQTQSDVAAQFAALNWQDGPTKGSLGGIATIAVPEGYRFLGKGDAGKFMELNQNPSDGSELGLLLSVEGSWFVVYEFSADGYVKDDDRELDADAILVSIKEGTEAANNVRRERGWSTMEIVGWQQTPFYDTKTNNLTWSIRGSSDDGTSINHSTRLLGRRGVMKANLVASPDEIGRAVPAFDSVMTSFSFNAGQRYAEFKSGDRVAEYGLAGLIVGGAGVALVKTGLLQKFWKVIVFGLIALAGVIKRLISSFTRGRQTSDQQV